MYDFRALNSKRNALGLSFMLALAMDACTSRHVTLSGGGSGAVTRRDSLQLTARTSITGDRAVVRVVARNGSGRGIHLEWGACPLNFELYPLAAREGRPTFDWSTLRNSESPDEPVEVCPAYLAVKTLEPGDSISPKEFTLEIPLQRLGADSLARGTHFVTARLRLGANDMVGISIPAGAVDAHWRGRIVTLPLAGAGGKKGRRNQVLSQTYMMMRLWRSMPCMAF